MNQQYKYNVLSFIIAIKRKNSNSKLLYKAKYLHAKDFSISPQTFCKLMDSAIELGWISKEKDGYFAKRFHEIILDFNRISGVCLWNHNILRSKNHNFKAILSELEQLLVVDNVINPQLTIINRKTQLNRNRKFPTVRCAGKREDLSIGTVRTSARHASSKLGISSSKMNKVLSMGKFYTRKQHVMKFFGSTKEDLGRIQKKFPLSKVWFSEKRNLIVVHNGSSLLLIPLLVK